MTSLSVRKAAVITALAAGFLIASTQVQIAQQPTQQPGPGAPAATGQPGGRGAIDPRVQQRTYRFADTNEELPYAVFVSSKVSKDKKNPLIVALHGLGGNHNTMMRPMRCSWRKTAATLWSARWVITRVAGMELLHGSEPVVAAAPELHAVRTARLQLEHLRAHHQRDVAHFRRHPLPEDLH